jgi:hypothetical protein
MAWPRDSRHGTLRTPSWPALPSLLLGFCLLVQTLCILAIDTDVSFSDQAPRLYRLGARARAWGMANQRFSVVFCSPPLLGYSSYSKRASAKLCSGRWSQERPGAVPSSTVVAPPTFRSLICHPAPTLRLRRPLHPQLFCFLSDLGAGSDGGSPRGSFFLPMVAHFPGRHCCHECSGRGQVRQLIPAAGPS